MDEKSSQNVIDTEKRENVVKLLQTVTTLSREREWKHVDHFPAQLKQDWIAGPTGLTKWPMYC